MSDDRCAMCGGEDWTACGCWCPRCSFRIANPEGDCQRCALLGLPGRDHGKEVAA